jgi:hypothetical protein
VEGVIAVIAQQTKNRTDLLSLQAIVCRLVLLEMSKKIKNLVLCIA